MWREVLTDCIEDVERIEEEGLPSVGWGYNQVGSDIVLSKYIYRSGR